MRNMDSLCLRMLLSPSNCHFSPTMHPWPLGSVVWESGGERWRDGGGWGGGGGHERVSLAERSLSISQQAYSALHPPPLNESHNKASSVCVVSSSIHVPHGKHSPSFFNSPLLSPLLSVSPALSVWSLWRIAPLKDLLPHDQEVWIYLTAHVCVCVCVCVCLRMFN